MGQPMCQIYLPLLVFGDVTLFSFCLHKSILRNAHFFFSLRWGRVIRWNREGTEDFKQNRFLKIPHYQKQIPFQS